MKNNKFLATVTKLTKDIDIIAIVAVNIYFLASLNISSTKLSFVVSFIFFTILVYYYSFYKAIVYSMLPLLYFGLGQIHSFIAVPATAIYSTQYWEGRQSIFQFSPLFVVSLSGLLLLLILWRKLRINVMLHEKLLLVLFGMYGLSLIGSVMPFFSTMFAIKEFILIAWGVYLFIAVRGIPKFKVKKILFTLAVIFSLILLHNSLLVFGQIIKSGALGLAIERTQVAPVFGLGADERDVFRPFGFNIHPNGLSNETILVGMSALVLLQYLLEKFTKNSQTINYLSIFVISISLLIIVLSLSRAAFIAIFTSFIFFLYRHPQNLTKFKILKEKLVSKSNLWIKGISIIILGALVFKLTNRLFDSFYSFTAFGGVSTRADQYVEAFEVFKNYPVFGVGIGMFMPASYQLFPDGIMRYFPEPVHNGFLLFMVERGLLTVVAYLFFAIYSYLEISSLKLSRLTKTVIYSGIISSFVMMIFHPQNNFLSFLIILILFIIHYEKAITKI